MPYYPQIKRRRIERGPERLRSRRPLVVEPAVAVEPVEKAGEAAGAAAAVVVAAVPPLPEAGSAACAKKGRVLFGPKPKAVSPLK